MRSLAQNPLPGILQFPKPASPEDSGRRHAVLATDPFPHEYPIHALSGILRQTSRETQRGTRRHLRRHFHPRLRSITTATQKHFLRPNAGLPLFEARPLGAVSSDDPTRSNRPAKSSARKMVSKLEDHGGAMTKPPFFKMSLGATSSRSIGSWEEQTSEILSPAPHWVTARLVQLKAFQTEHPVVDREEWPGAVDLIFVREFRRPVNVNSLAYKHFKPILKRPGLPNIRLYDLRHTAATLTLTVGVSPKVACEPLGHTSDVYVGCLFPCTATRAR